MTNQLFRHAVQCDAGARSACYETFEAACADRNISQRMQRVAGARTFSVVTVLVPPRYRIEMRWLMSGWHKSSWNGSHDGSWSGVTRAFQAALAARSRWPYPIAYRVVRVDA